MRQNPHGGDIYTKKCRVDFSVNVNPLGAPESVKEAVRKSAESVEQYPDALCRDLTRALSEKEQLPEENILFANGAAELIFALTQALRPKKALIAAARPAGLDKAPSISVVAPRDSIRRKAALLTFCRIALLSTLTLTLLCRLFLRKKTA